MFTYADTSVCPACREPLPTEPGHPLSCPACGLPLLLARTGELVTVLRRADDLVAALRTESRPAPAITTPYPVPYPAPSPAPASPDVPERTGLRASSVPAVLLSLGALCLLVAAIAFLAVAWSWLGVGGRTTVLVALTVTAATLGAVLARRGLRAAAESLTAVGAGLWLLDVVGADRAGWLGDLSGSGLLGMVGVSLTIYGVLTTAASRRLAVPQVTVPVGLLVVVVALADSVDHPLPVVAAAVAGLALVALDGRFLGLRVLAWSTGAAAVVTWLWLVVVGLDRLATLATYSWSSVWDGGPGWALGLASGYLLLPLVVRPRRDAVVLVCGSAAAVALTALALVPATDASGTGYALAALAATVGWLLAAHALATRWPLLGSIAAVPAAVLAVPLAGVAIDHLTTAADRVLTDDAATRLPAVVLAVHPLLLVPTALVVLAVVHLVVGRLGGAPRWRVWVGAGVVTALVAAVATVALHPVPVWAVLLPVVGLAAVAAVVALSRVDHAGLVVMSGALAALLLALGIAAPDAGQLTLVAAVVVAVALATLTLGGFPLAAEIGGPILPAAAAGLLWSIAWTGDPDVARLGVPTLLLVGAIALVLPRIEVEAPAALTALVTMPLAVSAADHVATSAAVHLTLAGVLVTTSSLVHPRRRPLGWLGGALLLLATWVRLADLGVTSPEAYTVPAALVLLVVGLARLRRDPGASSALALAPGLSLLTVPSLLWVLATGPVSLRALLLGLGCLALVLGGARLRWSAPLTVGATVGAVLALAEVAPYVAHTPQWVVLGTAGALLTVVGVTWERRLTDLRHASRALARLR